MNTNNCKNLKRIPGRILLALVAAAWLSWALPANAGTKTTVTAYQAPLATLWDGEFSFPDGNLHIQGNGGVFFIRSEDTPLLTGLIYSIGNLQWDAEGNGVMNGTWHLAVGNFDGIEYEDGNVVWEEDGITPKGFVATGGIWEGVFHAAWKGNLHTMHASGRGVAGEVEGLTLQGDREQDRNDLIYVDHDVIIDPKAKK